MKAFYLFLSKFEWGEYLLEKWAIKKRNKRLHKAIKKANALTNWDRKTRYVFESDMPGRFDIMSTSEIKRGRKLKRFRKSVTIADIYERAVYTATFNQELKEDWRRARTMAKERIEQIHKK